MSLKVSRSSAVNPAPLLRYGVLRSAEELTTFLNTNWLAAYSSLSTQTKTDLNQLLSDLGMDWTNGIFRLTDDKTCLDLEAICELLAQTSWAAGRPRRTMEQAIQHSVCLGLFLGDRQIGFARAVTDQATFAWICDVIIHPDHRGKGLGQWMVKCLLDHPQLQTRSQVLATNDAHGLYERFGFKRTEYMRRGPEMGAATAVAKFASPTE